ncbi:GPR endopeptidase [Sinanaerobacter sp. ZZT-01]|uniref:GPR endopeptidase n=1 Tax=Sinanaerobacter sp. ZZT-01 TaxID=3111540 RepID=UPI002D787743|nr:GPR endopeptidase [Sinanaerobacter sp. ZZT-01]WRR92858.1 GPR endopeptidase [Sinanaerobacter sp. ZZT-01]
MIRTDLAIENKEMYDAKNNGQKIEIPGVEVDTDSYEEGINVTRIKIADENGSAVMQKPMGSYITIELPKAANGAEDLKKVAAKAVGNELKKLVPFHYHLKVLVIGLGNEKVTPDALGPHTVSKIRVTRHLFLLYNVDGDEEQGCVSALCPGVMASTGMESAELIQGAAQIAQPEVVLAIDALAARNVERIGTTIQITDTGISPGAGTGNMRKNLTEESIGRKVIAIGVPTVIDAGTMVLDSLSGYLSDAAEAEKYLDDTGLEMIVTTSDIDQSIHDFSEIIADAINIALHPGIYS